MRAIARELSAQEEGARHKVRLLLDRGGNLSHEAIALPNEVSTDPIRLCLASEPVDSSDPFLFHKTTHRPIYTRARAARPDCNDVVLWNEQGEVTEGCWANIAIEVGGELWTPPLESGLLGGTYRRHLLELGKLRERAISVEEFKNCDRLWWMNSIRKLREANLVG